MTQDRKNAPPKPLYTSTPKPTRTADRWLERHFIRPDELAILEAHQMAAQGLGTVSFEGEDDAPVWTPAKTTPENTPKSLGAKRP